jgi:ribosomal-protein-serine acetyltransferase
MTAMDETTKPGDGLSLRYANSVEELAALEPVWNALQTHHSEITPDLGPHTPKRTLPNAWRIRRSKYERWLGDPDTFFVIATANGEPVGYAFVTIGPPYAGWDTGDRLAELETLSVLADRRSERIGAALLDAVWKRLAELDVEDMAITTTTTNRGAQRFYERQGFGSRFAVYYGTSPRLIASRAGSARHQRPACENASWLRLPEGSELHLLGAANVAELHRLIEENREHLAPWLPWAASQTERDTAEFVRRSRGEMLAGDSLQLGISRSGRLTGVIGHVGIDWARRSTRIGYWIAAAEQGRGTITAATRALVDHAFDVWALNRVEIEVATENARSRGVPERLGFAEEGTMRQAEHVGDRYLDAVLYAMLASGWNS